MRRASADEISHRGISSGKELVKGQCCYFNVKLWTQTSSRPGYEFSMIQFWSNLHRQPCQHILNSDLCKHLVCVIDCIPDILTPCYVFMFFKCKKWNNKNSLIWAFLCKGKKNAWNRPRISQKMPKMQQWWHVEDRDVCTSLIQALVTVVDSSKAHSSVCLRYLNSLFKYFTLTCAGVSVSFMGCPSNLNLICLIESPCRDKQKPRVENKARAAAFAPDQDFPWTVRQTAIKQTFTNSLRLLGKSYNINTLFTIFKWNMSSSNAC